MNHVSHSTARPSPAAQPHKRHDMYILLNCTLPTQHRHTWRSSSTSAGLGASSARHASTAAATSGGGGGRAAPALPSAAPFAVLFALAAPLAAAASSPLANVAVSARGPSAGSQEKQRPASRSASNCFQCSIRMVAPSSREEAKMSASRWRDEAANSPEVSALAAGSDLATRRCPRV